MSENTILNFGDLPVSIEVALYLTDISWSLENAIHPDWFLFWNPSGKVYLTFEEKEICVEQDHAVLIPPCTRFKARSEGEFSHLYAHFTTGGAFTTIRNGLYLLDASESRKFYRKKLYRHKEVWRNALSWRIWIYESLRQLPENAFSEKSASQRDSRIRSVLEYCAEDPSIVPDNKFLARYAKMSLNNFLRTFHRETGLSPQKYFQHRKLDLARKLLLETSDSIEKIALRCSYADRYHFSKAFKKYFGMTPGSIRRNRQEYGFIMK